MAAGGVTSAWVGEDEGKRHAGGGEPPAWGLEEGDKNASVHAAARSQRQHHHNGQGEEEQLGAHNDLLGLEWCGSPKYNNRSDFVNGEILANF